jgi:phage baseplate assembly protein W
MTQIQFNYPFRINTKGLTEGSVSLEEHIRQLIEQVLFTNTGERVNRQNFGASVNRLIFAPNSDELAATTELLIQGNLQQWLSDLITVNSVTVKNENSILHISIQYVIRRTQQQQTSNYTTRT